MTTPLSDAAWRDALPKISLFSHLEATPDAAQWWALLQRFGGDPRVSSEAEVAELFHPTPENVREFWAWKSHFLSTLERWTALAEAGARAFADAGVVYAEFAISPLDVEHHGWSLRELLGALNLGFDEVPDFEARVILDVHIERGAAAALDLVEQASDLLADGVVALHVGVDDAELDATWAPLRDRCEALGMPRLVRTTGHSALGATLAHLAPGRILPSGDWVDDRALLEQLTRDRVCLLLAEDSLGDRAGALPSAEWLDAATMNGMRFALAHPLPAFSTKPVGEALTSARGGVSRTQIRAWLQNAAGASALPYQARRRLIGDLVTDPVWFEELPNA